MATSTGSGIKLVAYVDRVAGVVLCTACAIKGGESSTMERVYSPDINEDTPPCFSCGSVIED